MVVEFRVLAVSKETASYDTDLIKGIFLSDHPILDTVDTLPITSVIDIISNSNWKATTNKAIVTDNYIFVPFIGEIIE